MKMETKNAVIKTYADHGVLSGWLVLDYGGTGQGFGGYSLYLPKSFRHHELMTWTVGFAEGSDNAD